jgi:hypothetical protein
LDFALTRRIEQLVNCCFEVVDVGAEGAVELDRTSAEVEDELEGSPE